VLVADDVTSLLLATPNSSRVVPEIPLSLTVVRSYEEVRSWRSATGWCFVSGRFEVGATDLSPTLPRAPLQFHDATTGAVSLLLRFNVTATADTRIGGFGGAAARRAC